MPPKVAAPLDSSVINLEAIREDGRSELIEIFEMHPGNKLLILDSTVGSLLSHIVKDASSVFEVPSFLLHIHDHPRYCCPTTRKMALHKSLSWEWTWHFLLAGEHHLIFSMFYFSYAPMLSSANL